MNLNERKFVFDPSGDDDPVSEVIELTSRKWTRAIVEHLLAGDQLRYSELGDRIDGISDKVLSESLQDLEEHGLVRREVIETRPVRVEYSLTETGAALEEVIDAVADWTDRYAEQVVEEPART